MSVRYEGAFASGSQIAFVRPGGELGDERMDARHYAITVSYDEVFYIQGTPDQLVQFAREVSAVAALVMDDSRKPLKSGDFYLDEDQDLACPRCDWTLVLADQHDLGGIYDQVRQHIEDEHA